MKRALVTGAAGFIGGHMCRYLKERGYWVFALDYKSPRYGGVPCDAHNWRHDLRDSFVYVRHNTDESFFGYGMPVGGFDEIYAFAADMGGMGYISRHHFDILFNNSLINLNTARYAAMEGTPRIFCASSACVYPERLQMDNEHVYLAEDQAWDGKPDTAYGVEKLFSEELYRYLPEYAGEVRIGRFHNIFGPQGSWNDGREKLPAAACRKMALIAQQGANRAQPIEIWGDGEQVRTFCYIDDCLNMVYRLMHSDYKHPLNIGSNIDVTVNGVYEIVAKIAGVKYEPVYDLSKPQGVRYRNMDPTEMRRVLGYKLQYSLFDGLEHTYKWIYEQVSKG